MAPSAESVVHVRVRLFAGLRETVGWSETQVELGPAAASALATRPTPAQLWRQLGLQPGDPPAGIRVAINQQFASWDTPLSGGDELAFLPPISGG